MSRVQAVPKQDSGFDSRICLAKAWRGLRDKELQDISGFSKASFVHHAGFIGGSFDPEEALQMAVISIKLHNEETKK